MENPTFKNEKIELLVCIYEVLGELVFKYGIYGCSRCLTLETIMNPLPSQIQCFQSTSGTSWSIEIIVLPEVSPYLQILKVLDKESVDLKVLVLWNILNSERQLLIAVTRNNIDHFNWGHPIESSIWQHEPHAQKHEPHAKTKVPPAFQSLLELKVLLA